MLGIPTMGIQGPNKPARRPARRAGTVVTVFFLFALPVLIVVMMLALNAALLAEARAELQRNADADALAALGALVEDDCWLTGHHHHHHARIAHARYTAQFYAGLNKVLRQPVVLEVPAIATANPPDGDIVFAHLDKPRSHDPAERVLIVADLDGTYRGHPFLPLVNTVRINARRTQARGTAIGLFGGNFSGIGSADLEARATATLDRDVVGFRPIGDQLVPLAPIALLTSQLGGAPCSWEQELAKGIDVCRFDAGAGAFRGGDDGLPEATMIVSFDETQASAALVLLGIPNVVGPQHQGRFTDHVAKGLADLDLQELGGVFALERGDNRLAVRCSRGDATFYHALAAQLNLIQGQKRIWPLYEICDAGAGQAVIVGFVAARVVQATASANGVALTLQPCLLLTCTAITDTSRRGVGGVDICNPYIAKLRLID